MASLPPSAVGSRPPAVRVVSVAAALVGGIPVFDAVSQGLVAGVAAIGGWEMILKHLLVKKTDEA